MKKSLKNSKQPESKKTEGHEKVYKMEMSMKPT